MKAKSIIALILALLMTIPIRMVIQRKSNTGHMTVSWNLNGRAIFCSLKRPKGQKTAETWQTLRNNNRKGLTGIANKIQGW